MAGVMKDSGLQWSIFDGVIPLKITKPLRLIELFAGIGAQAKALENLGVQLAAKLLQLFIKLRFKPRDSGL